MTSTQPTLYTLLLINYAIAKVIIPLAILTFGLRCGSFSYLIILVNNRDRQTTLP